MSYPKVDILYLSEKDMLDAGVNDVHRSPSVTPLSLLL